MILNRFPTPHSFPGYKDSTGINVILPEGNGSIPLMLMGEAGGRHENKDGLPFRPYAEAGSVLERALRLCGIDRRQVTVTNTVWYQPPRDWLDGAPWEHDAIGLCAPWNDVLVEQRRPKCILALGGTAWRVLSGMDGRRQGITLTRGFPMKAIRYPGVTVLGTYHPSFLRRGEKEDQTPGMMGGSAAGRGMDLLGVLVRDIQLALAISKGQYTPELDARFYHEHADVEELTRFYEDAKAHPELPIAYDIETEDTFQTEDESEIVKLDTDVTQMQYSLRPGHATICDWKPELFELFRKIHALPNDKLDWNGRLSDRLILFRKYGMELSGDLYDLMDAWHHTQPDLPKGLQYATSFFAPEFGPWKHLDLANRHFYGGCDVDSLQRIWPKLKADMQHLGIWNSYKRHIQLLGARVLDPMSRRGIRVDNQARVEFGNKLDQSAEETRKEIQTLVPLELRPSHPKEGYKLLPADLKMALRVTTEIGVNRITTPQGNTYIKKDIEEGNQETMFEIRKFQRWFLEKDFNPNSSDQLISYIKHQREQEIKGYVDRGRTLARATVLAKYKVPRDFKKDAETTAKREIIRLARSTGDLVLPKSIEYREFKKLKGTYVEGWNPANSHYNDGRAHPLFKFAPATGQLSSEEPNAQNTPKKSKLSDEFRKLIVPSPGNVLIELDYRSFHALTLGFEAQDASYMRLARLDIHSYFTACGLLKIWKPEQLLALCDDELREKLAWVKKTHGDVRDRNAKPTILGYGFGMGPQRLYYENVETISGVSEAKMLIHELDGLFKITAKFRKDILRTCVDNGGVLKSLHGYLRRFWNVFEHKPVKINYQPKDGEKVFVDGRGQRWRVAQSTDAEAVIAFLPANDAHGHIKEAMLTLAEMGLAEKYGLINMIHDSLIFDCPRNLADECVHTTKKIMERRSKYLINPVAPEGLWCEVEATIGTANWAKQTPTNPGGMATYKLAA